ncbi:MAG: hypothetical protein V3V31_10305 [Methylococcales bacterium]
MAKPSLYLDVCTLCRPFDDQNMMRIRLETKSYFLIMRAVRDDVYRMVYSPVHVVEIAAIRNVLERTELLEIVHSTDEKYLLDSISLRQRANELTKRSMGVADAAHVAFAEASADYFISCDDRLIKQCQRETMNVTVMTPVEFCERENLK